jgi:hypothetical protein
VNISPGTTKTFQVSVQNDGNVAQSFVLDGAVTTSRFRIRTFDGATEVTAAVADGTFTTPMIPVGGTQLFVVKIKALEGANSGSSRADLVRISSVDNPSRVDAVKALVSVP